MELLLENLKRNRNPARFVPETHVREVSWRGNGPEKTALSCRDGVKEGVHARGR
jgi:hypothetical protein